MLLLYNLVAETLVVNLVLSHWSLRDSVTLHPSTLAQQGCRWSASFVKGCCSSLCFYKCPYWLPLSQPLLSFCAQTSVSEVAQDFELKQCHPVHVHSKVSPTKFNGTYFHRVAASGWLATSLISHTHRCIFLSLSSLSTIVISSPSPSPTVCVEGGFHGSSVHFSRGAKLHLLPWTMPTAKWQQQHLACGLGKIWQPQQWHVWGLPAEPHQHLSSHSHHHHCCLLHGLCGGLSWQLTGHVCHHQVSGMREGYGRSFR